MPLPTLIQLPQGTRDVGAYGCCPPMHVRTHAHTARPSGADPTHSAEGEKTGGHQHPAAFCCNHLAVTSGVVGEPPSTVPASSQKHIFRN